MELFGLFIVIIIYLCLVYPASLAKKNAKGRKTVNFSKATEPQAAQESRQEAPKSAEESARVFETADMERIYQPVRQPFAEDDTLYMGSLNAVTGEGTDPCHEEQMADMMPSPEPAAGEPSGGLSFGWTGNEVVRGIVMSEVLKRRH